MYQLVCFLKRLFENSAGSARWLHSALASEPHVAFLDGSA